MKIIYRDKTQDINTNYQVLCIDELVRLTSFISWEYEAYNRIAITASNSKKEAFAKCGIIQAELKEYAYFGADCNKNQALYLSLFGNASWKDVYKILSDIERIELD